jgi:hypothetical protein
MAENIFTVLVKNSLTQTTDLWRHYPVQWNIRQTRWGNQRRWTGVRFMATLLNCWWCSSELDVKMMKTYPSPSLLMHHRKCINVKKCERQEERLFSIINSSSHAWFLLVLSLSWSDVWNIKFLKINTGFIWKAKNMTPYFRTYSARSWCEDHPIVVTWYLGVNTNGLDMHTILDMELHILDMPICKKSMVVHSLLANTD